MHVFGELSGGGGGVCVLSAFVIYSELFFCGYMWIFSILLSFWHLLASSFQ